MADKHQFSRIKVHHGWCKLQMFLTCDQTLPHLLVWVCVYLYVVFFGVICCGGETQIRFKDQYHIGVSHTPLVLLNTSARSWIYLMYVRKYVNW